jgi:hypothetical protein
MPHRLDPVPVYGYSLDESRVLPFLRRSLAQDHSGHTIMAVLISEWWVLTPSLRHRAYQLKRGSDQTQD